MGGEQTFSRVLDLCSHECILVSVVSDLKMEIVHTEKKLELVVFYVDPQSHKEGAIND